MTRAEAIRAAALAIADNVTDDPDRREALASELTALAFRWTRSEDPTEIRPGFHTFGPVVTDAVHAAAEQAEADSVGPVPDPFTMPPGTRYATPVGRRAEQAEADSVGCTGGQPKIHWLFGHNADCVVAVCTDGHGEQHAAHDFPDDPDPMYGPGHCSRCYADAPVTVAATPRQHEWLAVPKWNNKDFQLCNGCGIYRCNGGCGDPSTGAVPDADCPTHGDSVAQTCNGYPVGTLPPVGQPWDAQAHVTANATGRVAPYSNGEVPVPVPGETFAGPMLNPSLYALRQPVTSHPLRDQRLAEQAEVDEMNEAGRQLTEHATAALRSPCSVCGQVGPHRDTCPRRTLRTALPGSVHAAADALAATPRQHTWVTATDGDTGATLDFEHCGVCGVRRCTWLAGDTTTACDHDPDCPTHGDEIARRCHGELCQGCGQPVSEGQHGLNQGYGGCV